MTKEPITLKVTLKAGHSLTEGLDGTPCGVEHKTSPVCYADDPDATVLGTLPDGRAGLVVKKQQGWTAVYSSVPMLPSVLLRRIARLGNAHEYVDTDDVVWASHGLVAVSVKEGGKRIIRLPQSGAVRDLFTGQEIGANVQSFEADFKPRATRVFAVTGAEKKRGR